MATALLISSPPPAKIHELTCHQPKLSPKLLSNRFKIQAIQETKEKAESTQSSANEITEKYGLEVGLWKVNNKESHWIINSLGNYLISKFFFNSVCRYLARRVKEMERRNQRQIKQRSCWVNMGARTLQPPSPSPWSPSRSATHSSAPESTSKLFSARSPALQTNKQSIKQTHINMYQN